MTAIAVTKCVLVNMINIMSLNPLFYGAQVMSPGVNLILSSPLAVTRAVKPYLPEALQVMAQV